MKIVHVSTSATGGAGGAAYRLYKGMLSQGMDVSFFTLKSKREDEPHLHVFKKKQSKGILSKIKNRIHTSQKQKNELRLVGKPKTYEMYSFPTTDSLVYNEKVLQEADVIHLHWISGFINYPSFFKNINTPIVWTLHDMNPFQNGFHYLNDQNNNANDFLALENEIQEIKTKSYQEANINVVAPSNWLKEASETSRLFKTFKHHTIANGIDTTVFKIQNKSFARTVFNLPQNKKIILFISEDISNKRKGFDILEEALSNLTTNEDYTLVAIGKRPKRMLKNTVFLGSINDERLMALVYAASDAFILPSREDNLPNVMLESFLCGVPVIATPVGGMKEHIEHGINGLLANDMSGIALSKILGDYINGSIKFDNKKIREVAVEKFSLTGQVKKYNQLYRQILK